MSNRKFKEYTIWNAVSPQAVTSSTDATPIVVTKSSHGYSTGDVVLIYGHATNVAANGIYKITKVNANSFSLQDVNTGANIAGSGAGAGSGGVMILSPKIVLAEDFVVAELSISTASTATVTLKIAGSNGIISPTSHGDTPNFGGTIDGTNQYSFLQIVNLDDSSTVNGSTGIVVAGTNINNLYEVNVNAIKYLTVIPVSWTQGSLTIKVKLLSGAK